MKPYKILLALAAGAAIGVVAKARDCVAEKTVLSLEPIGTAFIRMTMIARCLSSAVCLSALPARRRAASRKGGRTLVSGLLTIVAGRLSSPYFT